MEWLDMLPDTLVPKDWMVKLDLKYVYLQVPIHPDHHWLLQFKWEGTTNHFQCLPFRLSSAPRHFTKILRPVVGFLRQIGVWLLIYLDDTLILHQDRETLRDLLGLIIQSSPGFDPQQQEINSSPYTVHGIPGFHCQNSSHADLAAQTENEKHKSGGTIPSNPQECGSQGFCLVHRKKPQLFHRQYRLPCYTSGDSREW